jgi:hypothetical protein
MTILIFFLADVLTLRELSQIFLSNIITRVGRSVESECLWSGIEELGLLIELLNFQVEIPTLNRSNSTIKVGFSSPLQGKTLESYIFSTT